MRCIPCISLGGLLILAMGRPLGAQRPLSVDAGVASAHFPTDNTTASGPYVRLLASGVTTNAYGSLDAGAIVSGESSGFGTLRGGIRTSPAPGFGGALDGELSTVAGTSHNGAALTGLAGARGTWMRGSAGGWLRAMAHASTRTNTTLTGTGIEAAAWYMWPQVHLTLSAQREWTRAELFAGAFRTGYAGTVPVAYLEGMAALHAEGDATSLDVTATARRDPDGVQLWERALAASLSVWTGPRVSVVFTGGKQLPDWIHGADATEFGSIGVRWWQPTPERARATRVPPVVQVSDEGAERTIRVRAPHATAVELMADFTNWEPRALTRSGDYFETRVPMAPGSHRMVVRIDGGSWRAAANTPTVDDEFGGKVGLLVVP